MTTSPVPIPRPLGLGDLLDRAFRLYRAHFWPLLSIAALILVPAGLINGLLTGSAVVNLQSLEESRVLDSPSGIDPFTPVLGYFGAILAALLIHFVANGLAALALTAHNVASLQQRPLRVGQGLRIAWRRFGVFIGMSLLRGLATLVVATLMVAPVLCVFAAWVGMIANAESNGSTLALLGFITLTLIMYVVAIAFYLIPTTYLSARWIVVVPGIVESSWGVTASLRGSWRLTRGNVWRCIGYLILLSLLNFFIASLPSLLINQVVIGLLPDYAMFSVTLSQTVGALFAILWLPLSTAAVVLLYYDLRVRNESYDLSLRIAQMEAEATPQAPAEPTLPPPAAG